MSHSASLPGLSRRDGTLFCEDLAVPDLAHRFGTPLYVYSRAALETAARDWLAGIRGTRHRVFYAVKSNYSLGVLKVFARLGLGFDIVSAGELARVIAAGGDPKNVVYSGVGKTREEMRTALKVGICCFNLENPQELERLEEEASKLNTVAAVSFRVNPDVNAKTHPYISTGLEDNKFGVSLADAPALYKKAARMPHLRVSGIDCHVGSQITAIEPFEEACDIIGNIVLDLKKDGIELDHIDFGGGLGVRYGNETPPSAETLVKRMTELTARKGLGDLTLFFEPGRSLSAEAGLLVMTAQYLKTTPHKHYCITDAGMNDMLRPTLYQAKMTVVNTVTHEGDAATPTDIVGPICESGDWLAKDERLAVREGDILAMTCAGAYGMTMSGNYNARPRAAEVLVDGEKATLIRRRETIVDLMRGESLPEL